MKHETTVFAWSLLENNFRPVAGFLRNSTLRVARHLATPLPLAICILLAAGAGRGDNIPNVFGRSQTGEAALTGILYDLKQTQSHQSSGINPDNYGQVVHEFISKKWDERVLNRYYRVSRPIFTTQIFVPYMNADEAPKAFGVEKLVKPTCWLIHYKGQVSAPSPGTYRFWGTSDDVLAVAVNGKTELVGCYPGLQDEVKKNVWTQTDRDGGVISNNHLHPGNWFTVGENEIIDFDAIIGERPGGQFYAFLLVEKKGETYQQDGDHNPIVPIFQLAPYNTPVLNDTQREPKFAKSVSVWKCYQ